MNIEYFKDPVWANEEHTSVNMLVKFEEHNVELPFTATANDCESHGVELFNRAVLAEAGEVKAFDNPADTLEELSLIATTKRNNLLLVSDWTQLPDVPVATRESWVEYRQALRDIPSQKGFPETITWPVTP